MAEPAKPWTVALLFAGLAVAWGFNYLFVRAGLSDSPPFWLATLRAGLGTAGVAAFLAVRRTPTTVPMPRGRRYLALLLGLPNTAVFFGLWFWAAGSVLPGETAVVVYTFPLWVAILSAPVLGRGLSGREWVSVLGGFVGVALVSQPWSGAGGGLPLVPIGALLVAAVSWALATVLVQRWYPPEELPEANLWQLAGGAAGLLAVSLIVEPTGLPHPSWALLAVVLWLGLVGTAFAYGVWYWLLGRTHAARLSAYLFLVPVVALGASALFFRERLDPVQFLGVAFVVAALYGIGRPSRARTGVERPA